MEGEAAIKKSVDSISILLVDHDTTSLAMVATILKDFNYQVVTVEHPNNALDTLRAKRGSFDLVISDLRTSDMDGIELQQAISQEFDLPVIILMSEDESDSDLILKALEDGAVFCITKPVRPDDLRDVWQFVDMKGRKNKADVAPPPFKRKGFLDEEDEEEDINFQAAPTKRPKVIWTLSLQNRFLDALRRIGVENVVPKTILEEMNVPGLTRENVASHLQKYRNFLRRVVDASKRIDHKRGADKIFGLFSINDISNIDHI